MDANTQMVTADVARQALLRRLTAQSSLNARISTYRQMVEGGDQKMIEAARRDTKDAIQTLIEAARDEGREAAKLDERPVMG